MNRLQDDIGHPGASLAHQSLALDGVILDVDAQWEVLTGYSAHEMVGHHYAELVPDEHMAEFEANLGRLLDEGELAGVDCFLRRKNGEVRNVQVFGRVAEGQTACTLLDVTDFRETEQALVDSEERFRRLFEIAPTPIAIHDGTSVVMANAACARFLGYDSPDEIVGSAVIDLMCPEDRSIVAGRFRDLMAGDFVAPPAEERFIRKDGQLVCGKTVAASLVLGGRRVVYVIILDLTDQREVERTLEESEQRFRDLFEFSADPIVVHDGAVALLANRAAHEHFGVKAGTDARGMAIADFIYPESLGPAAERSSAILAGGEDGEPIEFHLRRADGPDWYAAAKSARVAMGGRDVIQTSFHDLTARKESEEKLARAHEQLKALLDERTASLERVKQELSAVVAVVSRTVEMRDPYTAGHQRRVTALCIAIARRLGMSDEDVNALAVAARLHDVGKVGVPADLMSKPAKLTPVEYELMKTHVELGFEVLQSARFDGDVADIMHQHHERLDGSGYPCGLTDEQLLPSAKVLMVADVVEAMSSHRPYRPSLGVPAALDEIVSHRGVLYDAAVVDACVAVFDGGFDFDDPSF